MCVGKGKRNHQITERKLVANSLVAVILLGACRLGCLSLPCCENGTERLLCHRVDHVDLLAAFLGRHVDLLELLLVGVALHEILPARGVLRRRGRDRDCVRDREAVTASGIADNREGIAAVEGEVADAAVGGAGAAAAGGEAGAAAAGGEAVAEAGGGEADVAEADGAKVVFLGQLPALKLFVQRVHLRRDAEELRMQLRHGVANLRDDLSRSRLPILQVLVLQHSQVETELVHLLCPRVHTLGKLWAVLLLLLIILLLPELTIQCGIP